MMHCQEWSLVGGAIGLVLCFATLVRAAEHQFAFGTTVEGFVTVPTDANFDAKRGFGYSVMPTPTNPAAVFAVAVEEGNYEVTVRVGHASQATDTTIKAEARRLMVEHLTTKAGQYETRTFIVNVRKPAIRTGGTTTLNDREKGPPPTPSWDDFLTFEFNGPRPGVVSLTIKPTRDVVTVFLAGDSTVTDQRHEPYAGWGQMLPRFFGSRVAVSNHAESGLALFSFERQKRLDKVLSMMNKGDYLLIQFGHNDQKDTRKGAGPFTTYKDNLKHYVTATRAKGGLPVLVTPMERRRFDASGKTMTTLADYALAVRQIGMEEKVPVIDLHAMSLQFYEALGPEQSTKAFAHYAANSFPGQDKALKDDTHHNAYGGYELARCVVEGIRLSVPGLAVHLAKDAGTFDPKKPDVPADFRLPVSPASGPVQKPAGN